MLSHRLVRRSKGGVLILGFGRKPRAAPACVCESFSVADIHRPRRRQRQKLEHPAPPPYVLFALPEERMRYLRGLHPAPILIAPPSAVLVAAGFDKLQKPAVCYVMPFH